MTPTLSFRDLILKGQTRPFPDLIEWLNDKETMQFSEHRHGHHTMHSCLSYIKSFNGVSSHLWQIQNLSGEIVGTISAQIDPINKIVSDMGVLIGKPYWKRGYACQAWKGVSDWLFTDAKLRKIEGGTMKNNHGMKRVFEKSGFKLEGERLNHFLVDGAPVGLLQYAKFR